MGRRTQTVLCSAPAIGLLFRRFVRPRQKKSESGTAAQ